MPFYALISPGGSLLPRRYATRPEAEEARATKFHDCDIMEQEDDPDLVDAIEALIDTAMRGHSTGGEDPETFYECRACGEWDGHTDNCPIPLAQLWLNPDDADALRWRLRLPKK